MEAALNAMNGEATDAKAIVAVTQAKLVGGLNSISLLFDLHLDGVVLSFTLLPPRHSGAVVGCTS